MTAVRTLRIVAEAEAASLAVLLANLATAHAPAVTALGGPVHGACYLAVIACTWLTATATPAARWLAVVPGVGGLLALRRIARAPAPAGGGTEAG
ncbi:DUF3817 domain-containing protein [Micromonospora sp. NPDC004336]